MKKRLIALILILAMLPTIGLCEKIEKEGSEFGGYWYDLPEGIYEIGKDIPAGDYEIRCTGLDNICRISYSYVLGDDEKPDLNHMYSFSISYTSLNDWWQPVGMLVHLMDGYLEISYSNIRLWIVE